MQQFTPSSSASGSSPNSPPNLATGARQFDTTGSAWSTSPATGSQPRAPRQANRFASATSIARRGHAASVAAGIGAALAVAAAVPVWALPEDAEQPIHIRAESAEIERREGRILYLGSVRVEQGSLRVNAERMIVDYDEGKVVRITATGAPAHYSQALEADAGQVEADASTIVYHTQESRIDLKGDAHLTQHGNSLTGDLIRYDILAGRVDAGAPDQGPVRTTLMPATEAEQ